MAPKQAELGVGNVYQLRPAAQTAVVLEFTGQRISAQDELYNVLRPPFTNVRVHARVTEIAALQRRINLSEKVQAIASRPDCDDATRVEANGIYKGTESFLQTTLGNKTNYIISPALDTEFGTNQDYRDYMNTDAMSAALFDEQMPESDILGDIVNAVDAKMIVDICEQRADFVHAHEEPSLRKKGQAFTQLLVSLSQMQESISEREDLPLANAATCVLTGKTLHDLALLGEFGKEDRDLAIQAAIAELEKANASIDRAIEQVPANYNKFDRLRNRKEGDSLPENYVVNGIKRDIDWFLGQYKAEVGYDQTRELTPAELPELIRHLGAAARLATVA